MANYKKTYKKRAIILIIIFVLAVAALAMPILTSLEILPDYINVGENILTIPDLFGDGFSFEIITANWALWVLCIYTLVAALLVLKSLFAFLCRNKKRFFLITVIAILLTVVFIAAGYDFEFKLLGTLVQEDMPGFLKSIDYGIYAMAGAPLLILLLSAFAYKRND